MLYKCTQYNLSSGKITKLNTHLVGMASKLWLPHRYSNLPGTAVATSWHQHNYIQLDTGHMTQHESSCSNHQGMVWGWWLYLDNRSLLYRWHTCQSFQEHMSLLHTRWGCLNVLKDRQTPQGMLYTPVVLQHCNCLTNKCQQLLEPPWWMGKHSLEGMEYTHLVIQWNSFHLDKVTERYRLLGSSNRVNRQYKT